MPAQLPGARLVLAGVANSLDLTERALPLLAALGARPRLLPFPAYDARAAAGAAGAAPRAAAGAGVPGAGAVPVRQEGAPLPDRLSFNSGVPYEGTVSRSTQGFAM